MIDNLDNTFNRLKNLLSEYSPPLVERQGNTEGKKITICGPKKKSRSLAGRKIRLATLP